jgi:mRNA interferase RelE/StbE
MLGWNPKDPALDVKALTNDPEAQYRLRVGNYRVKYNRDDGIKIIEIVRIGHRKDVYR